MSIATRLDNLFNARETRKLSGVSQKVGLQWNSCRLLSDGQLRNRSGELRQEIQGEITKLEQRQAQEMAKLGGDTTKLEKRHENEKSRFIEDLLGKRLPEAFAMAAEASDRRLGAWGKNSFFFKQELWDAESGKLSFLKPDGMDCSLAAQIKEIRIRLESGEKASEILLSAEFYRAVRDYEVEAALRAPKSELAKLEGWKLEAINGAKELIAAKMKGGRIGDGASWSSQLPPEYYNAVREVNFLGMTMAPFAEQIMAGVALHEGNAVEMKTGEGKTLAAVMPAFLNSLTGLGVHIATVNEYLAERDFGWMGSIFRSLGTSVGLSLSTMKAQEKRDAYACDITYSTNSELGFDYLRDNSSTGSKQGARQRGYNFAIIDECDSILVDEAKTPHIITGREVETSERHVEADAVVKALLAKQEKCDSQYDKDYAQYEKDLADYEKDAARKSNGNGRKGKKKPEPPAYEPFIDMDYAERNATLSEKGVAEVEKALKLENITHEPQLFGLIKNALLARAVFEKGKDYVVEEKEVLLIDHFTGRTMSGRRYNEGLHQALEAKEHNEGEDVCVKADHDASASVTLPNYYRKYRKLAGMSGTVKEVREELGQVYKMGFVEMPTHRKSRRSDEADFLFATQKQKWEAVLGEIRAAQETGQPVLVGTASITSSELLSKMLKEAGIAHEVLNADPANASREAEIIAGAGTRGAVTVATNMAGRGTDIMLGEGVAELGGLYVIGTEKHEAGRIDRQLRGRAGRQGDPGKSRFFVSAEDELILGFGEKEAKKIIDRDGERASGRKVSASLRYVQRKVEGSNTAGRRETLEFDDVVAKQRDALYKARQEIIDGGALAAAERVCMKIVDELVAEKKDPAELANALQEAFPGYKVDGQELAYLGTSLSEKIKADVAGMLNGFSEKIGPEKAEAIARFSLTGAIDLKWADCLAESEELKKGAVWKAYANEKPVHAFAKDTRKVYGELVKEARREGIMILLTHASESAGGRKRSLRMADGNHASGKITAVVPEEPGLALAFVQEAALAGKQDEVSYAIEELAQRAESGNCTSVEARAALFSIMAAFPHDSQPFKEALGKFESCFTFGTLNGEVIDELGNFRNALWKDKKRKKSLAIKPVHDFFVKLALAEPNELYAMCKKHAKNGEEKKAVGCIAELGRRAESYSCEKSCKYLLKVAEQELAFAGLSQAALDELVAAVPSHDIYKTLRVKMETGGEPLDMFLQKKTGNRVMGGLEKLVQENSHQGERMALGRMAEILEGSDRGAFSGSEFEEMQKHAAEVCKALGNGSPSAKVINEVLDSFVEAERFALASWRVKKMAGHVRKLQEGSRGIFRKRQLGKIADVLDKSKEVGRNRLFSREQKEWLFIELSKLEKDTRIGAGIADERKAIARARVGAPEFSIGRSFREEELSKLSNAIRSASDELAKSESSIVMNARKAIGRFEKIEAFGSFEDWKSEQVAHLENARRADAKKLGDILLEIAKKDVIMERFEEECSRTLEHFGAFSAPAGYEGFVDGMKGLDVAGISDEFRKATAEGSQPKALAAIIALGSKEDESGVPMLANIAANFGEPYSKWALTALLEKSTGKTSTMLEGVMGGIVVSCGARGAAANVRGMAVDALEKSIASKGGIGFREALYDEMVRGFGKENFDAVMALGAGIDPGMKVIEGILADAVLLDKLERYAEFAKLNSLIRGNQWYGDGMAGLKSLAQKVQDTPEVWAKYLEFAGLTGKDATDIMAVARSFGEHPEVNVDLLLNPPKVQEKAVAGQNANAEPEQEVDGRAIELAEMGGDANTDYSVDLSMLVPEEAPKKRKKAGKGS